MAPDTLQCTPITCHADDWLLSRRVSNWQLITWSAGLSNISHR